MIMSVDKAVLFWHSPVWTFRAVYNLLFPKHHYRLSGCIYQPGLVAAAAISPYSPHRMRSKWGLLAAPPPSDIPCQEETLQQFILWTGAKPLFCGNSDSGVWDTLNLLFAFFPVSKIFASYPFVFSPDFALLSLDFTLLSKIHFAFYHRILKLYPLDIGF